MHRDTISRAKRSIEPKRQEQTPRRSKSPTIMIAVAAEEDIRSLR